MSFTIKSVIHWFDNDSFEIDINHDLRKEKVDSITGCSGGFMIIKFRGEETVRVDYPINLDDLPDWVEIKLKQWDGWKRRKQFLNALFVFVVVDHVKVHLIEIKDAFR